MSGSPAYSGKEVRSAITKKGFEESNGHHKFLIFHVDGKKTQIRTRISHGKKTYTGQLWNCLKKQLHLNSDQLSEFIECHLSEEQYKATLIEAGYLQVD